MRETQWLVVGAGACCRHGSHLSMCSQRSCIVDSQTVHGLPILSAIESAVLITHCSRVSRRNACQIRESAQPLQGIGPYLPPLLSLHHSALTSCGKNSFEIQKSNSDIPFTQLMYSSSAIRRGALTLGTRKS